ncbi:MAG: hypothetical protein LRY66_06040 [Saccharospirillaceae bacterium]|nr:hypothetical protein [Saccharospirillaceae bacterium]MCD8530916.1 hypothetical protein [Saccharospirillaceae bacterium]
MELNEDRLEKLVKKAAEDGTNNALMRLGFDTENHLDAQKDMAFLRQQRQASEQVAVVVRRSLIGLFISGAVTVMVIGAQHALNK